MSDANGSNGNGNGNGERMRAIARNEALQAWARLSMVTAPPIIAAILGVAAWFLSNLSSDVRATREALADYKTVGTARASVATAQLKEHDRRITVLEGRVFGYSAPPPSP